MDPTKLAGATTAERVVEIVSEEAITLMLETGKTPPPTAFALVDGGFVIAVMEWDSPEDKREIMAALWDKLKPLHPQFVVVLLDCYTKVTTGESAESEAAMAERIGLSGMLAAGDTRIKEALMFSVYPAGADSWIKMLPYERDASGKVKFLEQSTINQGQGGYIEDRIGPPEHVKRTNTQSMLGRLANNKHKETIH